MGSQQSSGRVDTLYLSTHGALSRLDKPAIDAIRVESMFALKFLYLLSSVIILQANAAIMCGQSNFGWEQILNLISGESFSHSDQSPKLSVKFTSLLKGFVNYCR